MLIGVSLDAHASYILRTLAPADFALEGAVERLIQLSVRSSFSPRAAIQRGGTAIDPLIPGREASSAVEATRLATSINLDAHSSVLRSSDLPRH